MLDYHTQTYYGVNKWGVADIYDSPEPISHPDPRLSADPPTLLDSYFNISEGPHRKSVIEYLETPMAGDEFRGTPDPGVGRTGTSSPNLVMIVDNAESSPLGKYIGSEMMAITVVLGWMEEPMSPL